MLAVKCFNAETGEELTDTSLSDRMIVIEWSDEHESVVYSFENRVLNRYYQNRAILCL